MRFYSLCVLCCCYFISFILVLCCGFFVVCFGFFGGVVGFLGIGVGGDGNVDVFVRGCDCCCRFKLFVVVLFCWVLCCYGCGRCSYIYPLIFKRVVSGVLAIL